MKLSNILIAALVTTCLATTAQTDKNKKDKPKIKTEKKVKKSKTKINSCTMVEPKVQINPDATPRICPACGRG